MAFFVRTCAPRDCEAAFPYACHHECLTMALESSVDVQGNPTLSMISRVHPQGQQQPGVRWCTDALKQS
eukprot:scaffold264_cov317-Pinguiococcus_pyrenoidosus.AAC.29